MFYTEYGTRSLIACIIVSITAYSWVGLQQGFDSVDSKIRNNMGWIILTAFAIQGLFGMAPAVYLDVDPWTSSHCIWAENVSTEHEVIITTKMKGGTVITARSRFKQKHFSFLIPFR